MKKTHLIALCTVAALLGACEPTMATRGNLLDLDALSEIKPGVTTREEVATKLGTPTVVSTFDEKVWYYVGRETEQYSFLDPDVVKQQAIEVDFDDQGVVTATKNMDLSQAADAEPVERITPAYGKENTILRELLGDLNHPMPDLKNQQHGGNGN
jgi:outer membrane protein assembly factor BamE (lipoprotein component of BamABCDE complex)